MKEWDILQKNPKSLKGIYVSIVNSGKEAGTEQDFPIEL